VSGILEISRLEPVDIRTIWKREENDFTPWLVDNIDLLAEKLNLELSVIESEKKTGSFQADIFAEDSEGYPVIIENQFGKTDHDHLGKSLTYLTNLEAKTMIWLCEDPRPEHVKAITWLNEQTPPDISYYLVKIEAYSISGSPPAPLFVPIVSPSPILKEAGVTKKELVERHVKRLDFWEKLLMKSASKTSLFANITPKKDNWIETSAGKAGLRYNYVILMDSARVELYIDTGYEEQNKKIFDDFYLDKDTIESEFGEPLDWQRLELKRACRIAAWITKRGLKDEGMWNTLQNEMIDKMIRLENVLSKRIKDLQ